MTVDDVRITDQDTPTRAELLALYDAVGWSAYASDPATLGYTEIRDVTQAPLRAFVRFDG